MRGILIKFGAIAGFIGVAFLYSQYDRATNYEQTTAHVTDVEVTCYLKKTEGLKRKKITTTKEGPCEIVEEIKRSHPDFQDFKVIRTTYVLYEYKSPADRRWHKGKHTQARHEDGSPIKFGDDIVILAHKQEPDKTQKF